MAYGTANVDNIQSSTAGTPVVFKDGGGTQIGTLCRAWVNFAGASGTINSSFNVTSVTRNSTGVYTINFTTSMTSSSYATNINVQTTQSTTNHPICYIDNATAPTTSAVKVGTLYYNNTFYDYPAVNVAIFR